jgi:uncharacterized membrane protein (GlpM family)
MKKHINKHNRLSFVFSAIPIIIHIVLYIVYRVNADDDLADLISSMGEFVIILPIVLLSSGAIYFFLFEKRYTLAVISNTIGRIAELWFYKSVIDFPSKFGISAICLEIAEIVLFLAICLCVKHEKFNETPQQKVFYEPKNQHKYKQHIY